MFRRILIANRGEVAVRVARTAREMGIATVGAVSRADRDASWVERLDEVVCVGPAPPAESYLRAERIVQAALQTRSSAVHPGWGFLAENARFAALCSEHGLAFVGPRPHVMDRLGRKLPAKRALEEAGLPGIPGSSDLLTDVGTALAVAEEVGWPVMLKADAGGGGRGMRVCRTAAELESAFEEAAREAAAAFGDSRLYLERYFEGGRHIELQILADQEGRAIHLGERECSVQRHHQKLIEESPSPVLDDAERERVGALAARAAAAIGYTGAGTVELLRDRDGRLWFMEMNARLQVEHPVTEMRSGVDLVREQLRIAANERLALEQHEVRLEGASLECRINAEDPERGFRPTPGRLEAFELAREAGPGKVRVDTHLRAGDDVPPYYDSLLAKVITWGRDRDQAIATMLAALRSSRVEGVATTIPLHLAVLESEAFRRGEYDTSAIPGWPRA
ncbi:MAG TPA: biotin carboxylase N-terminal domain-containing protein [Thermoanaerobaculia bacterium]|nr:biotin carboxylase N-terminal domain-containing protein [Thermoanaerobaculia bacterium]